MQRDVKDKKFIQSADVAGASKEASSESTKFAVGRVTIRAVWLAWGGFLAFILEGGEDVVLLT